MPDSENRHSPTIIYRPIRPSDLQVLEQIHASLFPIRYAREFFLNVVNGEGIISWGAVDISRPDGHIDELIGFVTIRIITVKESEVDDLLSNGTSWKDQTLVYILTLGVVEQYRNLGTASSLVREVIKYASSITSCRAVYLHVIASNQPAIQFYQKMLFRLIRRLRNFYYINGQHYDSLLFLFYINGVTRSPCSPIVRACAACFLSRLAPSFREVVAASAAYFSGLLKIMATKLWKGGDLRNSRWSRCKEKHGLLATSNKRILDANNSIC